MCFIAFWFLRRDGRTRLGEQGVDLIGQHVGDARVEVVDGLLHGLDAQTQRVALPLQQDVLLVEVAEALRALLGRHTFPLGEGGGESLITVWRGLHEARAVSKGNGLLPAPYR